jgi:uncharacterized protein (TIGR02118 family)
MNFSLFLTFPARDPAARTSDADLERAAEVVKTTPRLRKGIVYTPATASDPYAKYPPPPQLALQLYFDEIAALEGAIAPRGHLQALAGADALPSVDKAAAAHQAMLTRAFAVPDPAFRTPEGALPCSDLIHYPGKAADLNAWLSHYLAHHAPLMVRLPGVREVEIYTRIDWCGALPWPRVEYMQRNKVVFDSAAALAAALNSPIRTAMRADFLKFPPFTDANRHAPMATRRIVPAP